MKKRNDGTAMNIKDNTSILKRRTILLIAIPVIASGISIGESWFPEFIYTTFGIPSGYLASTFLGRQLVFTDTGEAVIPVLSSAIHITQSCSGFGFFCILAAAATLVGYECFKRSNQLMILLLPIAVYLITLFANASRILCGYYAHSLSQRIVPANFQPVIHQAVGVTVFLSVLVLLSVTWSRAQHHSSRRALTSEANPKPRI